MPRGPKNNRQDDYPRGRGEARGGWWRGPSRGRGRGRGRGGPGRDDIPTNATSPEPRPRHRYAHANADIDVVIQQWAEPPDTTANGNKRHGPWWTPKSRSGAGTPSTPQRGSVTPRRGGSRRGRGRGRGADTNGPDSFPVGSSGRPQARGPRLGVGRGKANTHLTTRRLGKDAPLSSLLHAERPLLRPVRFVRPTITSPFLFQYPEEVLESAPQTAQADTTEASHVPTADRVFQLFHDNAPDSGSESDDDDLQEVDFADLAQIRAEVDAIAQGQGMTTDRQARGQEETIEEVLEEVDFADLAAVRAEVDAAVPLTTRDVDHIAHETFTGVYNHTIRPSSGVDTNIVTDQSLHLKLSIDKTSIDDLESHTQDLDGVSVEKEVPPSIVPPESSTGAGDHSPLFFVDTQPARPSTTRSASDVILVDRAGHGQALGDQSDDDELIVYVAPHPRSSRPSPTRAIPRVELPQTSILTGKTIDENKADAEDALQNHDSIEGAETTPIVSKLSRKMEKRRQQRKRQKKRSQLGFGVLGAMLSEARLREADAEERNSPRWATRRKGDSDLDWGTDEDDDEKGKQREALYLEEDMEGSDKDELDTVSNGLEGMTLDPDLELDMDAMQGFLAGMSPEESRFVTMDDLEDEDGEDSGEPRESSDSELDGGDDGVDEEEEQGFNLEEAILIAESEDDSDDSDDDLSPKASFQARLQKMRERSRSQPPMSEQQASDDDEDEEATQILPWISRDPEDEPFITHINNLLEQNGQDLSATLDDPEFSTPVRDKKKKKKKNKGNFGEYHAAELEAQWARDRQKKAERRKERREQLLREALDPLHVTPRRGGQASMKKVMRAAARLDPSEARAIAPRTLLGVDSETGEGMAALERYIRAFALGASVSSVYKGKGKGKANSTPGESLALPPMDKAARRVVHLLALAFGLKSVSKGKGARRYTTLIRTARTGMAVNETKVRGIMRRFMGGGGGGGGGSGRGGGPKHREGEVVGKEAPKIGKNNIGFRMLASMGWSEGKRIGGAGSVGINDPLTAKIKHSKLGLGATR